MYSVFNNYILRFKHIFIISHELFLVFFVLNYFEVLQHHTIQDKTVFIFIPHKYMFSVKINFIIALKFLSNENLTQPQNLSAEGQCNPYKVTSHSNLSLIMINLSIRGYFGMMWHLSDNISVSVCFLGNMSSQDPSCSKFPKILLFGQA